MTFLAIGNTGDGSPSRLTGFAAPHWLYSAFCSVAFGRSVFGCPADRLGEDESPHHAVATACSQSCTHFQTCALKPPPKAGAQRGSSARWELCGEPPVRVVPTAIAVSRAERLSAPAFHASSPPD